MKTLKSRQEFERVFVGGRRYGTSLVRLCVLNGVDEQGKVAFVAAKRLGNAVFRNRCKRILREAARSCDMPRSGAHVILFATRATYDTKPERVANDIKRLLNKAHVL